MKKIFLSSFMFLYLFGTVSAQVKILFDATEGQTAGNADWVIDADSSNIKYTGTGGLPVRNSSNAQQDNAQRYPTPAQSGITSSTPETYWRGALSNWGIDMVKKGYEVETLPTFDSITYGNPSNPQDLSNYKVFIIDEPQFQFSSHVKKALMNFIHNGGGLFIISDHIVASRTNNGWDARAVWEDFITNNPVSNTAFGFKLDSVNISPTSANVNPSSTDSIIHGPEGNCPGMQWHNGTTFTLYPAENSSITGDVFTGAVGNTGVMAGHGRYGSGKFAFEGDSSPADDGTGDRYGSPSSGVYNGYTGDPTSAPSTEEETIIVNTTIWLATSNPTTAMSVTATASTNVSCHGGSNGSAACSVSGGTPSYTYAWSPSGGTSATASGLAAGTYTVTVTDAASNTQTASVIITQPTAIAATTTQTNVSCNGNNNGIANISATGGTAPFSYSWSPSGGFSATATGLSAGTYTCTITDSKGCTLTKSVSITQPAAALTASTTHTNVSCNGSNTGIANVSVSGGTPSYTYSWTPSGGSSATATGLSAGSYTCTITDSKGCSKIETVTITQPAAALTATSTHTNVSCNGSNTGTANVSATGGTPSYTYLWSPSGGSSATATGLAAGSYTCTITDSKGCSKIETVSITQPTAITGAKTQSNVSCNGNNDGIANVSATGGTPSYTYSWTPSGGTSATATGLSAGSYTCTITDSKGCSITKNFTITQPNALLVSTSSTNESGPGMNDGTATVNPSGGTTPYTYSWNTTPPQTTQTATGLSGGVYMCTVTDSGACSATEIDTVSTTTGVAEISNSSNKIILYPNPSNGNVTIVVGTIKGNPVLYFYDVLGQQVEILKINNVQTTIKQGTLPSGIYFYRLMNDSEMLRSGRLIIQK